MFTLTNGNPLIKKKINRVVEMDFIYAKNHVLLGYEVIDTQGQMEERPHHCWTILSGCRKNLMLLKFSRSCSNVSNKLGKGVKLSSQSRTIESY